jgi:type I restriction enzyme M protein
MAIKKSALYTSIWKGCDELRGGMDASQYKDYVLTLLFIKYISDKYSNSDTSLVQIPEGGSYKDLIAAKGQKNIGEQFNIIIGKLAEANDLKGVIDLADFNDEDKLGKGKDMVDRLTNLVSIFEKPELDFSKNLAEGDDLIGDAYEYLMRHFATQSGKSKGQFLTPAEVSYILPKLLEIPSDAPSNTTVYDPTCGSGSLLLKAAAEANNAITLYGQEVDMSTAALARMNMILHGNPTAEIWQDNTLARPHFKNEDGSLKAFDYIVANPPFSLKSWVNGFDPKNDEFGRFEDGQPPEKNGDFAFMQHIVKSLKSTGKAAVVLPHGVLFRGNTEAAIRKNLVSKGYIKGIIGLPANLFYGTGIPACVIVIDKQNAAERQGIFFMDASKGFRKDGSKNRLRAQDIHKIVDVFVNQIDIPKYSRMVNLSEIEANDYNLNIPRYIDNSEVEDLQDIAAHLHGGVPNQDIDNLNSFWTALPSVRQALFDVSDKPGYSTLKVAPEDVKPTIFEHPEFTKFITTVNAQFDKWKDTSKPKMTSINAETRPKLLLKDMSEALLTAFEKAPLIDAYDMYQRLMDYWEESFSDDVHLILSEGWTSLIQGKPNLELLPLDLIVNRYFKVEHTALEALEADFAAATSNKEAFFEDNTGEGGQLEEARDNKGALNKSSVQARLNALKKRQENSNETQVLEEYLKLLASESTAKTKASDAKKALDAQVIEKYKTISEEEVKAIVIEDKWLARMHNDLQLEVDRISMTLTTRVKELAERYQHTAPTLTQEVQDLESKVAQHLAKMGFTWN